MLAKQENNNNDYSGLENYRALQKISQDLINAKLSRARDYTAPKTKNSLRALAFDTNKTLSVADFFALFEVLKTDLQLFLNGKPTNKNRINKASEVNIAFNQLYKKAISDQQIPRETLQDLQARFRGILAAFVSGSMTGADIAKNVVKHQTPEITGLFNYQMKVLFKMVDILNTYRTKPIGKVHPEYITDKIDETTKIIALLQQTNIPYPEESFNENIMNNFTQYKNEYLDKPQRNAVGQLENNILNNFYTDVINISNEYFGKINDIMLKDASQEVAISQSLGQYREKLDQIENEFNDKYSDAVIYSDEIKKIGSSGLLYNEYIQNIHNIGGHLLELVGYYENILFSGQKQSYISPPKYPKIPQLFVSNNQIEQAIENVPLSTIQKQTISQSIKKTKVTRDTKKIETARNKIEKELENLQNMYITENNKLIELENDIQHMHDLLDNLGPRQNQKRGTYTTRLNKYMKQFEKQQEKINGIKKEIEKYRDITGIIHPTFIDIEDRETAIDELIHPQDNASAASASSSPARIPKQLSIEEELHNQFPDASEEDIKKVIKLEKEIGLDGILELEPHYYTIAKRLNELKGGKKRKTQKRKSQPKKKKPSKHVRIDYKNLDIIPHNVANKNFQKFKRIMKPKNKKSKLNVGGVAVNNPSVTIEDFDGLAPLPREKQKGGSKRNFKVISF
jgi:hypothetical protein